MANTYETAAFGSPNDGNVNSEVSQRYQAYNAGGGLGSFTGANGSRTVVLDFDETGPLHDERIIPLGAEVVDVYLQGTTGTAVVKVGTQTVTAARIEVASTYVTVTTAALLTCTGVTAGQVVVTYRKVAG